jgi:hypothetical protein
MQKPETREASLVELLHGLDDGGTGAGACQFALETMIASSLSPDGVFPVDFLEVVLELDALFPSERLLDQLSALLLKHTRLRRACVLQGWTSRLLLLLQHRPVLVSLCAALLSFSPAPNDIRALLRLARPLPEERAAAWPLLLLLLQHAATRQDARAPAFFYDFCGAASGIHLPATKLPSGGFSWASWIRVEAFAKTTEPYLLNLADETDQGVALKFSSNFMVVQSSQSGKKPVSFSATFPFKTGQWYFVCFTHEYHMIGSDQGFCCLFFFCSFLTIEACLYVDGQLRGQFALPYAKSAGQLNHATVGCCRGDRRSQHTFVGQMGAMALLDTVLNAAAVRALFELGPNGLVANSPSLQLGKSAFPVVWAFSPRAADGALCLETARGGAKGLHALKLDGTAEVNAFFFPFSFALFLKRCGGKKGSPTRLC